MKQIKEVKCTREIKLSLPCLFLKLQKCFVRNVHSASSNTEVTEGLLEGISTITICPFYCTSFIFTAPCYAGITAAKQPLSEANNFYPHVGYSVAQLGIAHKEIAIWAASYNHQHCTLMSKGIGRDFQKALLLFNHVYDTFIQKEASITLTSWTFNAELPLAIAELDVSPC